MTLHIGPELQAEVDQPVTKPGYLIELDFDPVLRYSTRGDQFYNGNTYYGGFVRDYAPNSGVVSVLNVNNALSQLVLAQGAADRVARIWEFWGDDAAAPGVTALQLDGFIDGVPSIAGVVEFSLFDLSAVAVSSPRMNITARNGFNVLPAPGLRVQWGASTMIFRSKWQDSNKPSKTISNPKSRR